jgi:hypothetical protein
LRLPSQLAQITVEEAVITEIYPTEADKTAVDLTVELVSETLSTLMQKYSSNFICQVHLYGDENNADSYTTPMVLDAVSGKISCEVKCEITANLAEESSFLEFIPIIDDKYVLSPHRFHCREPP